MERRELIQWLVATAGAASLDTLAPPDLFALGRDVHRRTTSRGALSAGVERIIAVAAEQILPGAADAHVPAFIDRMLAEWYTPEEREQFLTGLRDLNTRCRARAQRDFVDCPAADQVTVLSALDQEVVALRAGGGDDRANRHWFALLKYLTIYGWCTSEPGMRALGLYPVPWRYDGCAPV